MAVKVTTLLGVVAPLLPESEVMMGTGGSWCMVNKAGCDSVFGYTTPAAAMGMPTVMGVGPARMSLMVTCSVHTVPEPPNNVETPKPLVSRLKVPSVKPVTPTGENVAVKVMTCRSVA